MSLESIFLIGTNKGDEKTNCMYKSRNFNKDIKLSFAT